MRTEFHRASYICPEHPNCTDQTLKQAQTGTGHFHFSLLFYQKSTKSSVTTHFYSEITEVWILVVCNLIQTSLKAIGVTAPLQSKALLTLAGISCTTQINERTCNQYCVWSAQLILSFFDIIQNHSLYQTIHFSDEKKQLADAAFRQASSTSQTQPLIQNGDIKYCLDTADLLHASTLIGQSEKTCKVTRVWLQPKTEVNVSWTHTNMQLF